MGCSPESYVNHFYHMFQDNKTREKIAGRMRHSVTVAMKNYWKIDESLQSELQETVEQILNGCGNMVATRA
jgi:hypothetical protein